MARKLKNITITLDEETARWARVEAAHKDTSVSSLVADLLRERMLETRVYEDAMRRYLAQTPALHRSARQRYPSRDELHDRHRIR